MRTRYVVPTVIVLIAAWSMVKAHADFFSFSAANDSAGAYKGVVLMLKILCDEANHPPYKPGSDAAAACAEFNKK